MAGADFYEDDEPVEEIAERFAKGEKRLTGKPAVGQNKRFEFRTRGVSYSTAETTSSNAGTALRLLST